jgi:hypothetical protein
MKGETIMAASPGSLDFAKLARDARQSLDKEPVVEKKVKVAASEGGIPAPQNAVVDDTSLDDFDESNQTDQVETQEVDANESTTAADEPTSSDADPNTKGQSQEEKDQEIFDIPDTARVKVKIDGEDAVISYKEYKDRLRQEATVTQRLQNFAKTRDEFNAAVQRTVQELEARENALKNAPPVEGSQSR